MLFRSFICPYHRGDVKRYYGDPNRDSIRNLWSGAGRRAVQLATDPSRDCKFNCMRHGSNLELLSMREAAEKASVSVEDYDVFL